MLKIRRLKRYRTAKYPRRKYAPKVPGLVDGLIRRGGVSLVLLALIENLGCDNPFGGGGVGVTGPPPVAPDMVTENEARQIITQVFTGTGISLDENYRLAFQPSEPDSTILYVDGYNDSLRVGYEYLTPQDVIFTQSVRSALADSAKASGPYIKTIGETIDNSNNRENLEMEIEAFIDTLKAHGII